MLANDGEIDIKTSPAGTSIQNQEPLVSQRSNQILDFCKENGIAYADV